jgi:hypothetical protein
MMIAGVEDKEQLLPLGFLCERVSLHASVGQGSKGIKECC